MDRRVVPLVLALALAGCQAVQGHQTGHPTFSLGLPEAAPMLEYPAVSPDEVPLAPGLLPGQALNAPQAATPGRTGGSGGSGGGSRQVPALSTAIGTGELTIDLNPLLAHLQPAAQRRLLATVADIETVVITVSVAGSPPVSQTLTKAALVAGAGSATFTGLQPGTATVTVRAFDATNKDIGGAVQSATVATGMNTIIDFVVQLDPTYTPGAGDVITNVTFVDGPVIVGTPPPVPAASGTVLGTFGVGDQPEAIAFDSAGNPWVANFGSQSVTKLGPLGGTLGTFKPESNALIKIKPAAITIDAADNVYVSDYGQTGGLYKLKGADGSLMAKYTAGPYPTALALDKLGNLWAANYLTKSVTRITTVGIPPLVPVGSPIGATVVGEYPIAIAIDALNFGWVVNFKTNNVSRVDPTGKLAATYALDAASEPEGIVIDKQGAIWITHNQTHKVTKLAPNGTKVGSYAVGQRPRGIAIDKAGYIWVANNVSNTVTKLGPDGTVQKTVTVGKAPRAIGVDPQGFVWVTNSGDDTVTKIAP